MAGTMQLRRRPLTAAMLLALAVTSATLAGASATGVRALTLGASTNLANMLTRPLEVLFASAFWVPSAALFWPLAALVAVVVGIGERRLGGVRTAALFVTGHVGATLLVFAGVATGVAHGWLPAALATAVDVGPSYGLAAVGAALLAGLPSRRRTAVALLLAGLVVAVAVNRTPTDAGHLVAALLGLAAEGRVQWKGRAGSGRPGRVRR